MAGQLSPMNQLHSLHHQQRRTMDLRIPAIEKYAYCLCLHVKPTTIFIAVFKLIRALLFATILLNSEVTMNDQASELSRSFSPSFSDRDRSTTEAITILTRVIMASVSAVGIYAVVSGRAALLMPLYAMLLVDLFFALPAIFNRDLDNSFSDGWSSADFARNHYQPGAYPHYNRYTLILVPTIAVIVKIYFLCVVWKCYRYLRLIELVTPIRLSEIYPHIPPVGPQYPIVRVLGSIDSTDLSSGQNVTPPPYDSIASGMKPPNYEEAMKTSSSVLTNSTTNAPLSAQLDQQAQQTIVFTIPTPYQQTQNVSTQVIGQVEQQTQAAQASSVCESSPQAATSGSGQSDLTLVRTQ